MFGWINDCTECLVISKFGEETWHQIKAKAGCDVIDGGFLRYKYYPDSDTVQLVVAASEVLGISVDDVLHAFGDYFIDYVQDNGYSNVLECLGSNLRDWLSNLNTLHDHLQASYPEGFVAPVFWSEDDPDSTDDDKAILVYYYSQRGSLLVPLVVGLLKKLAKVYFDIEIKLDQLSLQDEDNGIPHTTWKVTTADPSEAHKLRGKRKRRNKGVGINLGKGDDETLVTAGSTNTGQTGYGRAFIEGGSQAAKLRVLELVKRSFFNEECELFHALTLEQYVYLVDYWHQNHVGPNEDRFCYEIWSLQDGDPSTWATLKDLPPKLNPATMDTAHFGGMVPRTGAYPPSEEGILQSFPPKVRVVNSITQKSIDLSILSSNGKQTNASESIETTICNSPEVKSAGVLDFDDPEIQQRIQDMELEIKWTIWNDSTDDAYHTFALGDLATTTTQQLYDLVGGTSSSAASPGSSVGSFDPIKLVIQLEEAVAVDDDEEDI